MNKGELRLVESDNLEVLRLYEELLAGTTPVGFEFRESLIAGVVSFLSRLNELNFEKKVYLTFDKLTALVWRIKELEAGQLGKTVQELSAVETTPMIQCEQDSIDASIGQEYQVDITASPREELLPVAVGLSVSLKDTLRELREVYQSTLSAESLQVQMLAPDYPLMVLMAVNLWLKIGEYLDDLSGKLERLSFSLLVFGAPVPVNYDMVEKTNIRLHSACSHLRIVAAALNRNAQPFSSPHLREVLDEAEVYPPYHRQLNQGVQQIWREMEQGRVTERRDFPLTVERAIFALKAKLMSALLAEVQMKEKPGDLISRDQTDDAVIDARPVAADFFLYRKILSVSKLLIAEKRRPEAELLIRAYCLAANFFDWQEHGARKGHFESWMARETMLRNRLLKARKRSFRTR